MIRRKRIILPFTHPHPRTDTVVGIAVARVSPAQVRLAVAAIPVGVRDVARSGNMTRAVL